jgi:hypothetical protein
MPAGTTVPVNAYPSSFQSKPAYNPMKALMFCYVYEMNVKIKRLAGKGTTA